MSFVYDSTQSKQIKEKSVNSIKTKELSIASRKNEDFCTKEQNAAKCVSKIGGSKRIAYMSTKSNGGSSLVATSSIERLSLDSLYNSKNQMKNLDSQYQHN